MTAPLEGIARVVAEAGGGVDDARDLAAAWERMERDWAPRVDRMRAQANYDLPMAYIKQPVLIEDTAPPEHVDAVAAAFARAGFEVEVAPVFGRKSADVLPWIVRVVLLVPVGAFFATFGAEAAKDAYSALKELLRDVSAARRGAGTGEGSLVLSDPHSSNLVLPSSLPDAAIEALREIEWHEKRGAWLVWDGTHWIGEFGDLPGRT